MPSANDIPSLGVKEGLSYVLLLAITARKTPNLAPPSFQDSVHAVCFIRDSL